jgi:competence protein ComEC
MVQTTSPLLWKKAPFLKILPAMIAGILIQWQLQAAASVWWIMLAGGLSLFSAIWWLPLFRRYKFSFINGIAAAVVFFTFGALLVYYKDVRNDMQWAGRAYSPGNAVVAVLNEPLAEKTKSFKANAAVELIIKDGKYIPASGTVIVYFRKDQADIPANKLPVNLDYGSRIIFKKPLQEIKNSGNPDGFNYKRYALFQGITYQVFLKSDDYEILPGLQRNGFKQFIFSSRERVLSILRRYIPGDKEKGLAEALLIGYKNDLDQALVQSYTNTGVVHIIAISGLHLGLIYLLLAFIAKPLKRKKQLLWLYATIIITGLWLFSFLAGAQPSVLRSAVMFTCIVLGQAIGRKDNSIFNTLAISAFLLLCINPFWLWDVGFQLSYAAVLSIIIFMRPIYNLLYVKNKAFDFIWKMNAVTLAAQVLTVPLSIYHFHQFPNFFWLTNFLAVPLSSLILFAEIFLCIIAFIPFVAGLAGKTIYGMIWLMNTWVERIEAIRFSLWDGLYISLPQMILLLGFATGISYWLMEKSTKALQWGLIALAGFAVLRSASFIKANHQQKIVVYNVPQRQAIDFIDGRHYYFTGDTGLLADDFLRNFHLKPSRIHYRISPTDKLNSLQNDGSYIRFGSKKILLIDSSVKFAPTENKTPIDLLVLSKNPKLYITKLSESVAIKQVVFDGSCPAWKVKYWKKDCDSLHIPWYDVTEKGAFVMNL